MAPNYQYHPKFKNRQWDGKLSLFSPHNPIVLKGLYDSLVGFATERGYQIETDYIPVDRNITREQTEALIQSFKPVHEPWDHQINFMHLALKHQCMAAISPTSSGKSFICYNLVLALMNLGPVLIVVPTVNLVEQLYKDFHVYSQLNGFDVVSNVHYVYAGQNPRSGKAVTISTWQSLMDLPESYFHQFHTVIGDECHHFKAKSLKYIIENAINAKYRIGMTGSLDGKEVNELTLTGLFGPIKRVAHTHQLMEEGKVAKLKVNVVLMHHKAVNGAFLGMDYSNQTKLLISSEERNRIIRKIIADQEGNKLVLFQLVDFHGKPLYKQMKEEYPEKEIYFISGKTPLQEREAIRKIMSEKTNIILIASYGTYSTGMNVPSIRHVFSTIPGNSQVRLLQSIGRVLRLDEGKTEATFWDFADKMNWDGRNNIGFKHLEERLQIYMKEKFNVSIYEVNL